MITIDELARLAGVSNATVSLVLSSKDNGRVGAARRKQILDLAEKHGYRFNPAARALAEGRTNRIGLCIAGTIASHAIIGEFSLHMRLGLFAESLQHAGYSIEIIQADIKQPQDALSRSLTHRMVDGLVFLNWSAEVLEKPLFSLRERGIPAVASGTSFNDDSFTWTDVDEPAAFRAAVERLAGEGRKRIALIDTPVGATHPDMEDTFRTAMERYANCPPQEAIVARAVPAGYETTQQAMREILNQCPEVEGIILTDNFLAQGVLNVLQTTARNPGKDVRVIGHGDTVLADQCRPKLSHYGLRVEEQVRLGTEALLEQIQDKSSYQPRHAMLPPEYIARET